MTLTAIGHDSSKNVLELLSPIFSTKWRAVRNRPLAALYERGLAQQWNVITDVEWRVDIVFGSALRADSTKALRSFQESTLSRYGASFWDVFRWEFQGWMVSQFLPGEQAAMLAASRLVDSAPDLDTRLCLASQIVDEARHIDVFSRYLQEHVPQPYPVSSALARLLRDTLSDGAWDITVLGTQILVETLALAAFRLADRTFHDTLIRDLCRRVAQDEARHVSLGVFCLRGIYAQMTTAELKYREDFVMEAANLIRKRFLLEEIWDRLNVSAEEGRHFAGTNEVLVEYRQIVCSKLVSALGRLGLLSRRLHERLAALNLLGPRHFQWNEQSFGGSPR